MVLINASQSAVHLEDKMLVNQSMLDAAEMYIAAASYEVIKKPKYAHTQVSLKPRESKDYR